MAQADLNVANQSGAAFRSDLNGQLLALGTLQSGASAPSTTYAYMLWADTTTGLLKIRNSANNAWIVLRSLDGLGSATAPSVAVGTGTTYTPGIYSPGIDQLAISTSGTGRLFVDSTGRVGVGTASPSSTLHLYGGPAELRVESSTSSDGSVRFVNTSGSMSFGMSGSAANIALLYDRTNSQNAYQYGGGASGYHIWHTNGTERARIDSSGRLLIGSSTSYAANYPTSSTAPYFQNHGTSYNTSNIGAYHWQTQVNNCSFIALNKSRGSAIGTHSVIISNDRIGGITFNGSDGTNFVSAATIIAFSDGIANPYIPGRLVFSTALDSSPVERAQIDSIGYLTGTVNGLGKGNYACEQYYRLDAALTGANVSTAQKILGVGVTLIASTVYEFEGMFALSKTTGTTSHTISLGFGGTATINNIAFQVNTAIAPSGLTTGGTASIYEFQAAAGGVVDAAQATAGMHFMALVKGTVSINAGGTLIPQYTLSAAPGGAYSTILGSYFKIAPLGASGANTSIGTWA